MKTFSFIILILLFTASTYAETNSADDRGSKAMNGTGPSQTIHSKQNNIHDWFISPTISIPFRGFDIQTEAKNPQTQDPLTSISYSPSVSLEGALSLSYKEFGFTYRHTLTSASLGQNANAPSSKNEEFRIGFLFENHLFELSTQRLVGLQTQIAIDNAQTKSTIARPDLSFTDTRFRWMYGLPIWGAEQPNSLANFYTSAFIPEGKEFSIDWLFGAEAIQQKISGSTAFIPLERQAVFGSASTLSEVASTGVGVGTGLGFNALMHGKSYFSIAGLLGGNYNLSKARFQDQTDDVSGFGAYMSARMSVQFVFGEHDNQNIGFKLFVDSWTIPAKESKVSSSDAAMSLTYGLAF